MHGQGKLVFFFVENPYIQRCTVKLVYKDHPRDQQNVVLINRWSLHAGLITWMCILLGLVKGGLYKQVVFIHRFDCICVPYKSIVSSKSKPKAGY